MKYIFTNQIPDGKKCCVYLLKCISKKNKVSYYLGWTNNVRNRFTTHETKKGAKYTRGCKQLILVGVILTSGQTQAKQLEFKLKRIMKPKDKQFVARHLNRESELIFSLKENKFIINYK